MVMEGENEHFSSLDITDSVLQQPEPESWTSVYHQDTIGERDTPEVPEEWEQIIWPVRPMTCTSPPLSFATVQWDMPDAAAETSSLMTECGVVSELGSGSVTIIDATSLSLHQYQDVHFTQEVKEEDDWRVDSQLLDSVLQRAGCDSEPCDAADMQEPTAQEKEDSAHELLHHYNEIPSTDSEVEEEHSATSDPVETVDFTDILEETDHSEDEVDSFIDLKLEEEQQEACVLLTGQRNFEEEHISLRGVETEEGGAEVEEKSVIDLTPQDESKEEAFGSCLNEEEVLEELLQSDDTGLLINENEEQGSSESEEDVEILQQPQEDPTGQSEEPEMCKDIEQNGDPRESEASKDNEELLMEEGDNTERIENSQEVLELTGKPEEVRCLPHEDCDQGTSQKLSPQAKHLDHLEMTEDSEQMQSKEEQQLGQSTYLEQLTHVDLAEEAARPENADLPDESASDDTICVRAAEQQEQTELSEQKEQMTNVSRATLSEQLVQPQEADESEITEQLPAEAEAEATRQTSEAEFSQVDKQSVASDQVEEVGGSEGGSAQTLLANGKQLNPPDTAVPCANGREVVSEMACRLAERLFKLDGIQRVDVVKHLDKDNDFSRAVGEEYLKFFDFTGETLDHALRSFLKVVVLIGETQERERVLQHFACRFHQCNPDSFSSSGSALALTCALMLLNTDLHGQNVGKSMSSSKFVFNLDGMNEEQNFNKDLLKSLYNSIKNEPLEWAVDEGELVSSLFLDEDASSDAPVRSKTNPFLDFPQDSNASEVKEGLLRRKLHADVDGKRTPWGKRGWKTFHGVLRGMVLYLEKVDYRRDHPVNEEVVSVHHSLAEPASEYTKKPHVFRLQTADWRVFLFQASCKVEMNSWISRINLVSALQSSPPFPAAVGSQRRFFRPILPTLQSAHSLERQLQSHSGMLQSFKADLSYLQKNPPERKKAKAKELEEHRIRAEYLRHEMRRYESYIKVLAAWNNVTKSDADVLSATDLNLFDKALCADSVGEEEEEDGLKKSHSTPALAEMALPSVIKVKRNISERRTYRRPVIPRFNKEA